MLLDVHLEQNFLSLLWLLLQVARKDQEQSTLFSDYDGRLSRRQPGVICKWLPVC